ncbi:cell cortex node protein Slf1 [Schizosaccharomyces pombe]|uniref:Skb1 localization factor 1 n=1 Tax=Schizosaccharomyces pombe (strain 972 / ATCC 24843) TaxID=284812 RepID=SLF1_SCHPO|nr:uncharacterized protein SPAC821.03c [Schizosaccharomyces pombe]Q9UT50.1 RecName: Full=Uncharacterized protein C821.03c [Schizosaccharomyces pombe 972h-]CAB57437.1 sequence orphan [Schizosaccharomyces pombe]|eukprot:NP_593156.1 uncharacterized protein SPAC821.03c [Schizosaccharomyces pombe]
MSSIIQNPIESSYFVEDLSAVGNSQLHSGRSLTYGDRKANIDTRSGGGRRFWSNLNDSGNSFGAVPASSMNLSYGPTKSATISSKDGAMSRSSRYYVSSELKATLPSLDGRRLSKRNAANHASHHRMPDESASYRTRGEYESSSPRVPQKSLRRYYSTRTAQRLDVRRPASRSSRYSKTSDLPPSDPGRFVDDSDLTPHTDFTNRFVDSDFDPDSGVGRSSSPDQMMSRNNNLNINARMTSTSSKPYAKENQQLISSMAPVEQKNSFSTAREQYVAPALSFAEPVETQHNHMPKTTPLRGTSTVMNGSPIGPYSSSSNATGMYGVSKGHSSSTRRPFFSDVGSSQPAEEFVGSSSSHGRQQDSYIADDSDSERSYRRVRDQYLSKPRLSDKNRYSTFSEFPGQGTPSASQSNLRRSNTVRPTSFYYEKLHIKNDNPSFQALPYETTTQERKPVVKPDSIKTVKPEKKKSKGFFKKLMHKISHIFD